MAMIKAAAFTEPGSIELVNKPIPDVGPNDALIKITTTTICGTDVHILKGEYAVEKGLTVGHEPVGIIEKLGSIVFGYEEGQRVVAGAICPSFTSYPCQDGFPSQDGAWIEQMPGHKHDKNCGCHGYKATAGWRFGNMIDGCQAEYVLVPDAQANLAPVPDALTDEQRCLCAPTSCPPASRAPKTPISKSVTLLLSLRRVLSVFVPLPVPRCAVLP